MIINIIRGNIENTSCKHVVFIVSQDHPPYNKKESYPRSVSFWPRLHEIWQEKRDFNVIVTEKIGERTFYGIVGYRGSAPVCDDFSDAISCWLDDYIQIPVEDKIAFVMPCDDETGRIDSIDDIGVLRSLAVSNKKVCVYML